jgi:heptosyltransferase-2
VAATAPVKPLRLLVVLPNWVGDLVMATPALRLLRQSLRGSFIGGLCRPGGDEILEGLDLLDEVHVERGGGVFGPKFIAARIRPRMYDTALLLTNSFSTALVARIAGIPRRVGYNRDGRGFLLTEKLVTPRRGDGAYAIIPACRYYLDAAESLLHEHIPRYNALSATPIPLAFPPGTFMELGSSERQRLAAADVLRKAGVTPGTRYAVLNPGGNNPAKRWPAARFAALADHLHARHGLKILVNGSPAEAEVIQALIDAAKVARPVSLAACGSTLGSLKSVVAGAALMVTNDTGPRHIAAAMGTPLVSLFGPTDHRWTIIPTRPGAPERIIVADPSLPDHESANDHPERCAIDRIAIETVIAAADDVLSIASRP